MIIMFAYNEFIVKITSWNMNTDSKEFGNVHVIERIFGNIAEAYAHADFMTKSFDEIIGHGERLHYKIEITTVEYSTECYANGGI